MTPAQHLTWDSRPGADGTNVHLPKYSEVEAETEPVADEGFTPGPWRVVEPQGDGLWGVLAADGYPVVVLTAVRQPAIANARLIAAAPEMYAALMALYAKIPAADVNDRLVEEFLAAEQALIKASGRVYP